MDVFFNILNLCLSFSPSSTYITSLSSLKPNDLYTLSHTVFISSFISFSEAVPVFTIIFACFSDIFAPPTEYPLSPSLSIILPVGSPKSLLFLKTEPAHG